MQTPPPDEKLVDWLDFTRSRSAHFIAEKTCEMICYLWHATPRQSTTNPYPSPKNSPPNSALTSSPTTSTSTTTTTTTTPHQLNVSPEFVGFVQKILETTQVSQSVIVLSLHYIYRLKERTRLVGPSGSEYRVAVGGLMMANKFLDDNTYTNKTWAEVSGIPLLDINKMEASFLQGVDYNLYVDQATYAAWLNLLKGLVLAKERDLLRAKGARRSCNRKLTPQRPRWTRTPATLPTRRPSSRARSTSPHLPHPSVPTYKPYNYSPSPAPSSLKRSAAAAFSPTSASFSHLPTKRSGITLHIPQHARPDHHSNPSPNDGLPLQGFARMNLDSSTYSSSNSLSSALGPMPSDRERQKESKSDTMSTLVQPYVYPLDERRNSIPKHLYFYTLACSPLEDVPSPMQSHSPPVYSASSTRQPPPPPPPIYPNHPNSHHYHRRVVEEEEDQDMDADVDERDGEYDPERERQREIEIEMEIEAEREREHEELERQRQLALERERERERQRKARLRVHKPPPPSTIRYSDYAYMPYVSSSVTSHSSHATTSTHSSTNSNTLAPPITANSYASYPSYAGSLQSQQQSSNSMRLPGPAALIAQTQSARTSPVSGSSHYHPHSHHYVPPPTSLTVPMSAPVQTTATIQAPPVVAPATTTTRHFDAVRFEVERTQGYAPAPPATQPSAVQQSEESSYSSRPRTSYYPTPPDHPPASTAPSTLPSTTRKNLSSHSQIAVRNPYPRLSPPTPITSTHASPVTGPIGAVEIGGVCRGACCNPTPATAPATSTTTYVNAAGAGGDSHVKSSPAPYSSLAGATGGLTATTTTTSAYQTGQHYERACVSAYTSPAMDLRRFSPPYSRHSGYERYQQPGQNTYQQQQRHASTTTTTTTNVTAYPMPTAKEREEIAYAQAQAQHYAQQQSSSTKPTASYSYSPTYHHQHSPQPYQPQQHQYDSPGVPSMPFANAGPPGVCQMGYYSGYQQGQRQGHTGGYTGTNGGGGYMRHPGYHHQVHAR